MSRQARETVKRYDDATSNLHNAVSEQQEIDRRANEVGAQLVKNMDQLGQVTVNLKDLDRKRSKQERLLKDINQVGLGDSVLLFDFVERKNKSNGSRLGVKGWLSR